MQNSYKEKLRDFVVKSILSRDEKLLWELFLKISKPEEDEAVFEAAIEDDGNLLLLSKHLADKIFHMGKDNKMIWKILTNDEKKFAKFMNQLC